MPNPLATASDLPLRDIHLPESVSWWPLAPGWWMIAAGFVLITLALFMGRNFYRSKALHRDANAEMEKIKHQFLDNKNQYALIQSLSILLRRSCISFYPRHETAGLTGDTWLKYLDNTLPTVASSTFTFFNGVGEILSNAPYMSESSVTKIDGDALIILCETWLSAQPVKPSMTRAN